MKIQTYYWRTIRYLITIRYNPSVNINEKESALPQLATLDTSAEQNHF